MEELPEAYYSNDSQEIKPTESFESDYLKRIGTVSIPNVLQNRYSATEDHFKL
jgi:hypothetical protein